MEGRGGGIEITKKFLEDATHYLNPKGRIYIVLSTLGNIKKLVDEFNHLYNFEEIGRLPFSLKNSSCIKLQQSLQASHSKSFIMIFNYRTGDYHGR